MERERKKAEILIEALPYIREFWGKTIVIKYGGAAMVDDSLKKAFADDVVLLRYVGIYPVIVHGGGPQIGKTLEKMGKDSVFVRGLRVTDDETMDVVEMVLGGKVNKEIVSLINLAGGRAAGLTGKDGRLIMARKYYLKPEEGEQVTPEIIDIGKVGEVERVNPEILQVLMREGFIPVIAPVGVGAEGETYNINADHVASAVASALKAEKLVYLTDVEGVKEGDELISTLTVDRARKMIKEGAIGGGMIPKVECAIESLKSGVRKVHIVDGRIPHCLLLEIFTASGVGTEVVWEAGGNPS
ncbi:MAG: acetylglutamate kinase [Deltaproteobacteria bacterium]|nr:MAG: acetylglutamate kinase [Deltaproteobacteria bacterium]